jgi:hypothetical protein
MMATQRYPEQRLAGLRAHAERGQRATVQKLSEAIASLETRGLPVSSGTLLRECGIAYSVYARNPEALALFRAHSATLVPAGGLSARSHAPKSYDCRPALERLQEAITALEQARKPVTATNLLHEHGLHYNTLKRHPEAMALFHEHSAGEKTRRGRQQQAQETTGGPPRNDPLLRLRKAALVALIRQERAQFNALQERYSALLSAQNP